MKIKVYLDEDVPLGFAQALSNRGVDVLTTQQVENGGNSDPEQLVYTTEGGRTIFTHNKKDFILLNNDYLSFGEKHCGIILSDQLPIGVLLKRFMNLWFVLNAKDMETRLEFLSSWK